MRGVTPQQLKDSTDATQFSNLLKQRGYYGSSAAEYAAGLRAKLLKINVIEFIQKNKTSLLIGVTLLLVGSYYYFKIKKK
jgi:hypothetical protein